jgi:hypothetical protein
MDGGELMDEQMRHLDNLLPVDPGTSPNELRDRGPERLDIQLPRLEPFSDSHQRQRYPNSALPERALTVLPVACWTGPRAWVRAGRAQ